EPDVGSILVDEAQMQAALINMSVNARDAMPNGGTLTIKAGKSYINGQEANRPLRLISGQYSVVEISDSGVYASGFPGTDSIVGAEVDRDAPLIAKPYRKNDLARVLDQVLKGPEVPAVTVSAVTQLERLASPARPQ